MKPPHFFSSYNKHIDNLLQAHDQQTAMALAVGGEFEAVGLLQYYLFLQQGLKKTDIIVDVGCGSGRTAYRLKDYLTGKYIGLDVVPELIDYARKICERPDWKFYSAPGLTILEPDECADFVSFFSVFTHLLHDESYRYLQEAKRVLKPGGKIIFSFLEFLVPSHWMIFEATIADTTENRVLNQFISRDAIQAWTEHLGLSILEIYDGDKPHIPLDETVRWSSGQEMVGKGNLGQSVCILTK